MSAGINKQLKQWLKFYSRASQGRRYYIIVMYNVYRQAHRKGI